MVSSVSTPPQRLPAVVPRKPKDFGAREWSLAIGIPTAAFLITIGLAHLFVPRRYTDATPEIVATVPAPVVPDPEPAVAPEQSPGAAASAVSRAAADATRRTPQTLPTPDHAARTEYVQGHWVNGYTRSAPKSEYTPSPDASATPSVDVPPSYSGSGDGTYVNGYTRKDGTYVNGYTRGSGSHSHGHKH